MVGGLESQSGRRKAGLSFPWEDDKNIRELPLKKSQGKHLAQKGDMGRGCGVLSREQLGCYWGSGDEKEDKSKAQGQSAGEGCALLAVGFYLRKTHKNPKQRNNLL